jgi:uncharacterized membrane protein
MTTQLAPSAGSSSAQASQEGNGAAINVSAPERLLSALGGGALVLYGLRRAGLPGAALAALGGALVHRGVTGHSMTYGALGVSTAGGRLHSAHATVDEEHATHVRRSVTILRPREELYAFWRNFENLPRFMDHLERVDVLSDGRSHWVAKAPAGTRVEWDAVITTERENELIAWESVEPAQIPNRGFVRFSELPRGRGTEVTVELDYEPPGGKLGRVVAKLFGEEPDLQVREDLRRFKQLTEAGEIPTTARQPSCRNTA